MHEEITLGGPSHIKNTTQAQEVTQMTKFSLMWQQITRFIEECNIWKLKVQLVKKRDDRKIFLENIVYICPLMELCTAKIRQENQNEIKLIIENLVDFYHNSQQEI